MVITLCGSARFEDEFHRWNELLTLHGHVVFSLAVYPSVKGGNKDWYDVKTKMLLDLIHLAKIEQSEAVGILNKDDYIGESTFKELVWAKIRKKHIFWLEPENKGPRAHSLAELLPDLP